MTDYEIQKANDDKVGVVSSPENIFECRKAILEKLGGDSTNADTIYECDKRILPLIGSGSTNQQEKSVNITENGTTSVVPDEGYSLSKVDVNVDVPPTPTQEKSVNITENGTTSVLPDAGYNLSKVDVNVNVPLKLANGTKFRGSTFTVLPDYDFSDITDMSRMFEKCPRLTSITRLDTSNVINMSQMFFYCARLNSITKLDTSNVTNVVSMFSLCRNLGSLSGLTNLGKSFTSAQTLDLSKSNRISNSSVQNIINTVYDMNQNTKGGKATLKLNQTVIDAMTDEQKSQLAAKGWTLTS